MSRCYQAHGLRGRPAPIGQTFNWLGQLVNPEIAFLYEQSDRLSRAFEFGEKQKNATLSY